MGLGTILLIVLVLFLISVIPRWPYSKSWGYAPSGIAGMALAVWVVVLLLSRNNG
jgi:Protein of unknown function (DUF3309)